MPSRLALVLVLLLAGCGPPLIGQEGHVQVILDSRRATTAACDQAEQAMGLAESRPGYYTRGCAYRFPGSRTVTIRCPHADATCLAHEMRHLLEPGWKHE